MAESPRQPPRPCPICAAPSSRLPEVTELAEGGTGAPDSIAVALARVGAREADAAEFAGAFPTLDTAQLDRLRSRGAESSIAPGQVLFREGDVNADFIVVLEGHVQAVAHYGTGGDPVSAMFEPGQFVGIMNILSGEGAYVTATATSAGRILRIPLEQLRALIGQDITLSEVVLRAFLLRHALLQRLATGPKVIGSRYSSDTRRILDFLARSRIRVSWLDLESDPAAEQLLRNVGLSVADTPIVLIAGRPVLRNPSVAEVADAFGVSVSGTEEEAIRDLLVVGAGPAGLAAAVYGGSEGLSTVVLDSVAIGGQAGTSSRIENYLGFPAGLSGSELAARAALQAEKFAAAILLGCEAQSLVSEGGVHTVRLADGRTLSARAVLVATGARYRRLPLDRLAELEGSGVFYAATDFEARACSGAVAIVGGGNSAGQAAVFLAGKGLDVHLVVRRPSLEETMSRYLIDEIERTPGIVLHYGAEVRRLNGDRRLSAIVIEGTDGPREVPVTGLFSFIGAQPNTMWLGEAVKRDGHGFVLTGQDLDHSDRGWQPLPLETSVPGVFCAGDARHGSIKRVATAVGEGAMAVRLVHDRRVTPDT